MVHKVQESGAMDLWSFEIQAYLQNRYEGCWAMRIGWLDRSIAAETQRQMEIRSIGEFFRGLR
jgi:hypothetical protein